MAAPADAIHHAASVLYEGDGDGACVGEGRAWGACCELDTTKKNQCDAAPFFPSAATAVRLVSSPDGTRLALLPPTGGALLFEGGDGGPTLVDARGTVVTVAAFSRGGAFACATEGGDMFVVTR